MYVVHILHTYVHTVESHDEERVLAAGRVSEEAAQRLHPMAIACISN